MSSVKSAKISPQRAKLAPHKRGDFKRRLSAWEAALLAERRQCLGRSSSLDPMVPIGTPPFGPLRATQSPEGPSIPLKGRLSGWAECPHQGADVLQRSSLAMATYALALERAETPSYHLLIALCRSEIGRFMPFVAKSTVASAVISATENRGPAANSEDSKLALKSS
jgi:hypothetical protein